MHKINLDLNWSYISPEFLSIVPFSWAIDTLITITGGKGRDKNFVFFEVRGGMKNVVEVKLIFEYYFSFGSNVAFPLPLVAL